MKSYRQYGLAACVSLSLFAGWTVSTARGENEEELALQQERQKQIKADTESMVRRLGTMLRVLDYYQIDKAGERKMLEEMSGVLSGLSKNQMNEVIQRLEAAAQAKDEAKSSEEVQQAYARHREILDSLKNLLSRHDAVRNLDQAADRLEKFAKNQLELHFQTGQLIKDSMDRANPNLSPTQRLLMAKRRNFNLEPKRQGDAQIEIHHDVDIVIQQVLDLRPKLPDEQKERVALMQKVAGEQRLLENLTLASKKLKTWGTPTQKFEVWTSVNETQWKAAGQMKELARILRVSSELLAVLREARERVDQAIVKQEELNKETKTNLAKEEEAKETDPIKELPKPQVVFPDLTPLPAAPKTKSIDRKAALEKATQDALAVEKSQALGKEQARLEYDTKDTADLVKPHVQELAKKLDKAEEAMKDARDALIKNQPKEATAPQDKAATTLKEVRKELDTLIAAAEKQKDDPLTALKKAADDVEKLLKEQTDTRDKTKDTVGEKQNLKVPELAKSQKDLANRTEQLKDTPLPTKDDAKNALDKANKAMTEAAKALDDKKAGDAVPKQEQAIKALEDAKKEIGEKVAELEKRKDDLAKLEDAAQKLEQLAKAEKNIADKAKDLGAKNEPAMAKDLAKNQDKLTPEAKEVAKNIEAAAPDAAKKVNEGTKNMEAAKKDLDQNKATPAAAQAKEAAKKLEDAQKAIAKAMDDLKAKDIADQAALQPNKLDPLAAAQQIAKALEQTEKAAAQAKQAEQLARLEKKEEMNELERDKVQKSQPDLAKLQENIAKQADKMNLPEAAKDAAKAAEAIKQGDINKALENQEKALAKLQEAAQKPQPAEAKNAAPMPAEAKSKPGEAKAGEPKAAQPKAGEAKAGEAKAGEKPAQPKANEAKPAEAKATEPKAGEPKAAQAKAGEAKAGEPKAGEPKPAAANETKAGAPKAEAKAAEPKAGDAKPGEAKDAQAKAGDAKAGEPMQGEAKLAKAPGDEGLPLPKNTAELAKAQKDVMEATKALAQSQDATQAAMAALGQAQAQAPKAVQKQLDEAGKQLAKANQELDKGKPGEAGKNQAEAAKELGNALKALNAAVEAMAPKLDPNAQAKAGEPGQPGQEAKEGMGPEGMGPEGMGTPKDGQPKAPGKGKAKQPGPGEEKNEPMGQGDRVADGKTSNGKSQLSDVNGDGSFLHLPPRQRELIRQALSGQLPPEYAAMIQQYYINIARGRAAPGAAPALPAANR